MSERDRLIHPVTGSLAAVSLLLLAAWFANHFDRHHTGQTPSPQSVVPAVGPSQEPPAQSAKSPYDQADLQAQQTMAAAAWAAVGVSSLALIGLFFTVRYALFAWQASERSAIADEKALGLTKRQLAEARDDAEIQSRAYVLTENGTVSRIMDSDGSRYQIHCSLDLKNSGQTPAFDVTLIGVFGWFTREEIEKWTPYASPSAKGVIAPGASNTTNKRFQENYTDIVIGVQELRNKTIWTRGVIRYRDFSDQWWEHGFWYRFKDPLRLCDEGRGKTMDFPMTPHAEGNYLKKINN